MLSRSAESLVRIAVTSSSLATQRQLFDLDSAHSPKHRLPVPVKSTVVGDAAAAGAESDGDRELELEE